MSDKTPNEATDEPPIEAYQHRISQILGSTMTRIERPRFGGPVSLPEANVNSQSDSDDDGIPAKTGDQT